VPGANSSSYLSQGQWRLAFGYRTFHSHRHFTGAREDTHRTDEESEVVNDVHALDLGATYALTQRFNLFANLPVVAARRSLPIRDANRAVIGRYLQQASGIGDLSAGVRGWLFDPASTQSFNVSLGLGVKFPSGAPNVVGTRRNFNATTGQVETSVVSVDQSIQPGDGGLGALLQFSAFWGMTRGAVAYVDGSYLFNPMDTSGVETFRTRKSESIMSIADQYLLRVGAAWAPPGIEGLGLMLGGRLEGVPVRDLLGDSNGFRRPGFSISVDPGLSYSWGRSGVSLNVPIALHRERQRSLTDLQDGVRGDAAFADYLVAVSFMHTL
jgi:hypothetical protein